MAYAQYKAYVNIQTKKLVDIENNLRPIKADDRLKCFLGDKIVLCVQFIDSDGNYVALDSADTFECAGDLNYNHYEDAGDLTEAITAGSVSTVKVQNILGTVPSNGTIQLYNGSDPAETVVYQSYSENAGVYTFTLYPGQNVSYNYSIGDSATVADGVMFFSDNSQVDIAGDWADINRAQGRISIRLNFNNYLFLLRLNEQESQNIYLEIKRTPAGETDAAVVLLDKALAYNTVTDEDGAIAAQERGTFVTSAELSAAVDPKLDKDFTGFTAKTSLADDDLVAINDSADSYNEKKTTLLDVKTYAATTPGAHASSHEDGGSDEIDVTNLSGLLADAQTPLAHKTSHQDGGSDEIDVTGLSGLLADAQNPLAHASSHRNGGGDELDVSGLSGELADPQPPKTHASSHEDGGSDALNIGNIPGVLQTSQIPSDQQMTKANIEANLTGTITSHDHNFQLSNGISDNAQNQGYFEDEKPVIFDYEEQGNLAVSTTTKSLIHFEGLDGETQIFDRADDPAVNSLLTNHNVEIDTSQIKLGISTGLFNGTNAYLELAENANRTLNLGSSEFCIDFYFRANTISNGDTFLCKANSSDKNWRLYYDSVRGLVFAYNSSADTAWQHEISGACSLYGGQWFRIRVFRKGGRLYLYKDGTKLTDEPIYSIYNDDTVPLLIGVDDDGGTLSGYIDGNMDEFRLVIGESVFDPNSMDNSEQMWFINKKYILSSRHCLFTGTSYSVSLTSDKTLSRDYLNKVVPITPDASGRKVYLPFVDSNFNGNRIVIRNTNSTYYFWLYPNSGGSDTVNNVGFILIPPTCDVELSYDYSNTNWNIISDWSIGRNDLSVDIAHDSGNDYLQDVINALPRKSKGGFLWIYLADGTYNFTEQFDVEGFDYIIIQAQNASSLENKNVVFNSTFNTGTSPIAYYLNSNYLITISYIEFVCDADVYACVSFGRCYAGSFLTNTIRKSSDSTTAFGYGLYITSGSSVYADNSPLYIGGNFNVAVKARYNGVIYTHGWDLVSGASMCYLGFDAQDGKISIMSGDGGASAIANHPYNKSSGGQIFLPTGQLWETGDDVASCMVYLSGDQTISSTGDELNFDSVEYDEGGNWSSNYFTCPVDGIYLVNAQFVRTGSGFVESNFIYIMIAINGTMRHRRHKYGNSQSVDVMPSISVAIKCSKNDTIYFKFYTNKTDGTILGGSTNKDRTFATISLLHRL